MGKKLITGPVEFPVTLAEAKLAATESGSVHDAAFQNIWIPAACDQAEHRTGRALVSQTWLLTLDEFLPVINLPLPPLQSVSWVKYLDLEGVLQTVPVEGYQVITDEIEGRLLPAYGEAWPATRCWPGAVQIQFIAGYGAAADVPQSIKNWMLMAISTWYRQREGVVVGNIVNDLPRDFCEALLDKYIITRI